MKFAEYCRCRRLFQSYEILNCCFAEVSGGNDCAGLNELISICKSCDCCFAELLTAICGDIARGVGISLEQIVAALEGAVNNSCELTLNVDSHVLKARGEDDIAVAVCAVVILVDIAADNLNVCCFLNSGEYAVSGVSGRNEDNVNAFCDKSCAYDLAVFGIIKASDVVAADYCAGYVCA